jgi:predicted  nucleic acid-binding Zn-ribbon protein
MKRFYLTLLLVTLVFAVRLSWSQPKNEGDWTGEYRVDFLNEETRSVSVPLGLEDGLTGEIFFALLDDENRVISEIYPFEILHNRFWSGPLSSDAFASVKVGTVTIRVSLNKEDAQRVLAEFQARAAALQGALVRNRRERLLITYNELEGEILQTSNRIKMIRRERLTLQESLKEERRDLTIRVDRINSRLDQMRDELGDLKEKRNKLVEERKKLNERQTPPESRIERLNHQISDLDDEITEIREEVRDLREERIDAERDAERRGLLKIRNELDDLAIDEGNVRYELEQLQSERDNIKRELDNLKQFQ